MIDRYNILLPILALFVLIMSFLDNSDELNGTQLNGLAVWDKPGEVQLMFGPVKDTIYLLGDRYVEIHIKQQIARYISRKDSMFEFKISSGNKNIAEGMETPSGLYTVQAKNPLAISKQFNDAEMYFWVGFSSNFGFHGLKGNGYYARLGHTASSHGCVRVSREDCEKLFNKVGIGTPVIVYNDEPARVLKFGDASDYNPNRDILFKSYTKSFSKMMRMRIKNLYDGKAYTGNIEKIFLDGKTMMKPGGYYLGRAEMISYRQELVIGSRKWEKQIPDNLLVSYIVKEKADTSKRKNI